MNDSNKRDIANVIEIRQMLTNICRNIDNMDLRIVKAQVNAIDKMLISAKDERTYNQLKATLGDKFDSIDFYEK